MKQLGIISIAVLVVIAIGKWNVDQRQDANKAFADVARQLGSYSLPQTSEGITLFEFSQLRSGMSYLEARIVVGEPGTEVARHDIDGIAGVTEPITTIMYSWQNDNGSSANAMFQNGKLIQKAQAGLR